MDGNGFSTLLSKDEFTTKDNNDVLEEFNKLDESLDNTESNSNTSNEADNTSDSDDLALKSKPKKSSENVKEEIKKSEEVINYLVNTFKVNEDSLVYADNIGKVVSIIDAIYERISDELSLDVDFTLPNLEKIERKIKENERLLKEIREFNETTRGDYKGSSSEITGDEKYQRKLDPGEITARASDIQRILNDRRCSLESKENDSIFGAFKKKKKNNKNPKTLETLQREKIAKETFFKKMEEINVSDEEMREIEKASNLGLSYEDLCCLVGKTAEQIRVLSKIIMKG